AQDCIRDDLVTGVHTCALPIFVEVLVVDDHIAVLPDLETLQDLAVVDLVLTLGAPPLVADGRLVVRAELTERNLGARFRRVVEANRYRDHPERHNAFPHRSRHAAEFICKRTGPGYFS